MRKCLFLSLPPSRRQCKSLPFICTAAIHLPRQVEVSFVHYYSSVWIALNHRFLFVTFSLRWGVTIEGVLFYQKIVHIKNNFTRRFLFVTFSLRRESNQRGRFLKGEAPPLPLSYSPSRQKGAPLHSSPFWFPLPLTSLQTLLFVHSGRLFAEKVQFLLLSKDNLSAVRSWYWVYSGVFLCEAFVFYVLCERFVHRGEVWRCLYSHSFNFI